MLMNILQLGGKNMRHGVFHRRRDVDDDLPIRCRLPYIQNGIADLHRILYLGAGKALRTVFEPEIPVGLIGKLFQKNGPVNSYFLNFRFIFFEHLLALGYGCRVI